MGTSGILLIIIYSIPISASFNDCLPCLPKEFVAVSLHDDVIKWKYFPCYWPFCAENSPVTGELLAQRPVARSFDVLFDLCLNKQLSKRWRRRWFETSWRHCNDLHTDPGVWDKTLSIPSWIPWTGFQFEDMLEITFVYEFLTGFMCFNIYTFNWWRAKYPKAATTTVIMDRT